MLAIDIGTAILAIVPLFFISIPQPPRQVAQANGTMERTTYWQDLRAGLAYVGKWPGLLGLILLAMALNFLLSPSSSLLPLLITKGFGKGAQELAWVESAFGVGVILGGITLSAWGGFKRRILTSFMGIIGIGIGVILTGAVPSGFFTIILAANFILGFAQVMANGPIHAIFQAAIAPDMQGRVFSLISAGATAMMPLSLLVAGPVSDLLGIRFWYVVGGSICILMTLAALFIPPIMNIESGHQEAVQAAD